MQKVVGDFSIVPGNKIYYKYNVFLPPCT